MAGHVGDHAPHGGPIVLPVVDNRVMYLIAIVVGTMTTALTINLVKIFTRRQPKPESPDLVIKRVVTVAVAAA